MRIQIKLSKYFHPIIHLFFQNMIQNQTKQRKKSTPLTSKNPLNNCLSYFYFRTCQGTNVNLEFLNEYLDHCTILCTEQEHCFHNMKCMQYSQTGEKNSSFKLQTIRFFSSPTKRIFAQFLLLTITKIVVHANLVHHFISFRFQ